MYQIVGLPLLLKVFAWLVVVLAIVVAATSAVMEVPTGWGWVKFVLSASSTGVAIATSLVALLANSRVFSWCCRQRWMSGVFPDLAGEWVGELRSNWPRIAARGSENVGDIELLSRPARATITTTLFTVCMELDTDDRYSNSKTLSSTLSKDPITGKVIVYYVYENTTLDPKAIDLPSHYGAAMLTLRRERDHLVLDGPYWTNRAWNLGLNTAGVAIFRKSMTS